MTRLERIVIFDRDRRKYDRLVEAINRLLPSVAHESVFISYSHADSAQADDVSELLERLGVKVWMDRRDMRGPDFGKKSSMRSGVAKHMSCW